MRTIALLLGAATALTITSVRAQRILDISELRCAESEGAVHVTPLFSDTACSSFLICVDKEVRAHLHRTHTEHVFVLDGEAIMRLGDSTRVVHAGETIIIPPGTPHAVKVNGSAPLRVISVQAPYFDGSDRVWLDKP